MQGIDRYPERVIKQILLAVGRNLLIGYVCVGWYIAYAQLVWNDLGLPGSTFVRISAQIITMWWLSGPLLRLLVWLKYWRYKAILVIQPSHRKCVIAKAIAEELNLPLIQIPQQGSATAVTLRPVRAKKIGYLPNKVVLLATRNEGYVAFEPQDWRKSLHNEEWIARPRGVSHDAEFELADPSMFDQIQKWLDDYFEHPWLKSKRLYGKTRASNASSNSAAAARTSS